MTQAKSSKARTQWWGEFEIPAGKAGRWQVGDGGFRLDHADDAEWHLTHWHGKEGQSSECRVQLPLRKGARTDEGELLRFAAGVDADRIRIVPRLADRPVVSRPEVPFSVLAGEEITLYVSTPLWARLELVEGARALTEFPFYRSSDTWFGPSTIEGELCYASRTHCRRRREELSLLPHRAVTTLHIRNETDEPLLLERINLPVPTLSLYHDADGNLWTQSVTLQRKADAEMASLRREAAPPPEVGADALVSGPREKSERTFMTRAFGALFH